MIDASAYTGTSYLYGKDGNDTLIGGSGSDFIKAGSGDDLIDGGAGSDSPFTAKVVKILLF